MTWYSKSLIDPCPGLLEQLIVCCVAQRLTNQSFKPNTFTTDFVRNSIVWSTVTNIERAPIENEDSTITSVNTESKLTLSVRLPRAANDMWVLQDIPGGDFTPNLFSANASYAVTPFMQTDYPRISYPAKCPAYLNDFTSDNYKITNTLERRIASLFLQIKAYQDFLDYYRHLVKLRRTDIRYDPNFNTIVVRRPQQLISREQIDGLLADAKIIYNSDEPLPFDKAYQMFPFLEPGVAGDPSSGAEEQSNAFGDSDPLSAQGNLADAIKDLLDSSGDNGSSGSSFGTDSVEQTNVEQKESTTLEVC